VSFVPAPGCVRVILAAYAGDGRAYNFIWFHSSGSWTTYDPFLEMTRQEYLNFRLEEWWSYYMTPLQNDATRLIYIRSRLQDVEDRPNVQRDVDLLGALSGATPPNAALVATLRTGFTGRSYRGRFYMGGIPSSWLVTGVPNIIYDAYVADFLDAMAALGGLAPLLWKHVVVSHFADGAERESAVISPVTEYTANARIDSQRRRLRLAT